MGSAQAVPRWFRQALAESPEERRLDVEGCEIATLSWGRRGAPVLVLVHGGAAHARWWSGLAPLLARDHRVVAIDLSGHGDSGRRRAYRADQWAREVLAVATSEPADVRPVVAGHSMGGFVTIVAAANHGADLQGVVVLDAPVRRSDPESAEGRAGRMFREPKTYPDLATAMEHFHLVPPQPCENTWMLTEVARQSLHAVDDGWTWKFDPRIFTDRAGPDRTSDFAAKLGDAACRVAIVNGELSSIVDQDVRDYMAELLAGSPAAAAGIPFVQIPEAHHHLLFDQPLALVTALRSVLAVWSPVGRPPPEIHPARGSQLA